MAETITIRTDEETEYALHVLTHDGSSRSAAIRQAVLEAAGRCERAAEMRRAVLRMDLGQPDGVNVADELARDPPGAVSRLPAVLDQIDLIDLDPRIRILAQAVEPATVRSLDAIHLGTALYSGPGLTSFVTYDKRLLDAAQTAGLPVNS